MTNNSQHKLLFDLAGKAVFTRNSGRVRGNKGQNAAARGPKARLVGASEGAATAKVTAPLWRRHFERTSGSPSERSSRASPKALHRGATAFNAPASPVDLAQAVCVIGVAGSLRVARGRQGPPQIPSPH